MICIIQEGCITYKMSLKYCMNINLDICFTDVYFLFHEEKNTRKEPAHEIKKTSLFSKHLLLIAVGIRYTSVKIC